MLASRSNNVFPITDLQRIDHFPIVYQAEDQIMGLSIKSSEVACGSLCDSFKATDDNKMGTEAYSVDA